MKIWEAIQMLEQMDQTKEVTITFGNPSVSNKNDNNITRHIVGPSTTVWRNNEWPNYPNQITCGTMQ